MPGQLLQQVPLARYTSWRVGGPADYLYQPDNLEDLIAFLPTIAAEQPIHWLGLGSNVLIQDAGIRGFVIVTQGSLNSITRLDNNTVRVEAGVGCPQVARFCARNGLIGGEFLAGVPGTMGGALAMNAGAFGGETWSLVIAVETLSRDGILRVRKPQDYQVQYRQVDGPKGEWFVAAHLQLQAGDKEQSLAKIRTLLERRAATQPTGEHSCGSVFRNPPGDYAARLIETCGLKGLTRGGASVSTKHANFIINDGSATAIDIIELIREVADTVQQQHGIKLRIEAHILGESK